MKKLLYNHKVVSTAFTSLCLAAMATSCSQELEESKVQTDNNPAALNVVKLNFATSALTRGTMYDDIAQMPDDATFGVYGYGHKDGETTPNDANFINNGSAKKKDGKYIVHVSGKVATYKTDMPKVQLAAVYPQLNDANQFKKTGANTYTFTYSLQKDMAQQKDLMIGQAEEFEINDQNPTNENTNSGKTINMHHALTAINFAIGDRVPTGYTIERIYLRGLYTKGTCKVDLSKNNDAERFTWTPLGDKDKKENYVGIKLSATTTKINGTPFTGIKGKNGYDNLTIFIIPQKLTSDAVAEVYLKKDATTIYKDENGKSHEITKDAEKRANAKKIIVYLQPKNKTERDDKNIEFKAGQQKRYYINTKNSDGITYSIKKIGNVIQKDNSIVVNVECYRYSFIIKEGKIETYIFKAPQKFSIQKITYKTYKKKTDKEKGTTSGEETIKQGPNSFIKDWNVTYPERGDSTKVSLTLTLDPKKAPKVTERYKKNTDTQAEHPLGSSKKDYILIYLVADGSEKSETITCSLNSKAKKSK